MSFSPASPNERLSKLKKLVITTSGLAAIALFVPASGGQVQPSTRQVNCSTQAECRQIELDLDRLLTQRSDHPTDPERLMHEAQQLSGKASEHQEAQSGVDTLFEGRSTKADAGPHVLQNEARILLETTSQRDDPSSQSLTVMAERLRRKNS